MKLEKASFEAIKFACKNFHYSKSVPVNPFGLSVFNNKNEWCGTVVFSMGANRNLGNPFGLNIGEFCELTRMALNGKQEITSKILSTSLKLLPKYCPLIKLVISFADGNQDHIGTIYQACNFYYTGESKLDLLLVNGKKVHRKSIYSIYGYNSVERLNKNGIKAEWVKGKSKLRYIFPINKSLIPLCKSLSKPYPKKSAELPHTGEGQAFQFAGAFDSTIPLNQTA